MSRRVVALSYYDVQMRLVLRSRLLYSRFEDVFCFFYELAVQVYCVSGYASLCVVLEEDEFAGLLIQLLCGSFVSFAFFRKSVCFGAVARLVCLMRLLL